MSKCKCDNTSQAGMSMTFKFKSRPGGYAEEWRQNPVCGKCMASTLRKLSAQLLAFADIAEKEGQKDQE